jgi:tRNA-Thr(GGU) m(6)t(6)A37 methyltransferase TsaA
MPSKALNDNPIIVRGIGTIFSPFREAAGTPIQSVYGSSIEGRIVMLESYTPALDDIEGFERLWLIYWMDRTGPFKSKVLPYRDKVEHGLFATRSPNRPNPIGMSVVRFVRRENNTLYVTDMDILDGTPLLDIKPYVPEFDCHLNSRAGWFDRAAVDRRVADGRFHGQDDGLD